MSSNLSREYYRGGGSEARAPNKIDVLVWFFAIISGLRSSFHLLYPLGPVSSSYFNSSTTTPAMHALHMFGVCALISRAVPLLAFACHPKFVRGRSTLVASTDTSSSFHSFRDSVVDADSEVASIIERERDRQRRGLELIASENFASSQGEGGGGEGRL